MFEKLYSWLLSVKCSASSNNKVVMTDVEFIEKLYNLTKRPNKYNNHYPYNLLYYDGEKITADCWNLVKSLIWDPTLDQNYTVGKYANHNKGIRETGLGDWTVSQMIDACYKADPTSVSGDMSDINKIPVGALLYYYNGSHAGVYVGDGQVIESTPIWAGGIQITELSPVNYEGKIVGKRSVKKDWRGYWTKWARMPWIDYTKLKPQKYNINIDCSEGGMISTDKQEAQQNEVVQLIINPADNFKLKSINCEHAEIREDNTFIMPAADILIKAEFVKDNNLIVAIIEFIKRILKFIFK